MYPDRKIAVSEITTSKWTFQEDVAAYARTEGVTGIGVWRNKLSAVGGARIGAGILRNFGLSVSTLAHAGRFTDPATQQKQVEDAQRAIEDAHVLGAGVLLVVSGPPQKDVDPSESNRLVRAALERLSTEAVQAGVVLALEPMHPVHLKHLSTVYSIDRALDVIAGIPGTGLLLDTWHVWQDPWLEESIARAAGKIAAVHVDDFRKSGEGVGSAIPGEGQIPLGDLINSIENTGYRGWYELEIVDDQHSSGDYHCLLRSCVAGMYSILAS